MRKLLLMATLACALTIAAAAPAMAQRDPFEPLVDPNAGTTGTTTDSGTTGAEPDPFQENGSDGLPNTGGDPSPWLVIAYGLVALGAGALVLAKISRPQYLLARRR